MQTEKAFEAVVSGRVQGVGFRYKAKEEADRRDISGWVRNLNNGDVQVYAEGAQSQLNSFLTWLNTGPSWAYVEKVHVRWLDAAAVAASGLTAGGATGAASAAAGAKRKRFMIRY